MNRESLDLCLPLLPRGYVEQAKDARRSHENAVKQLLEKRKIPSEGWSDLTIELLLRELSAMDMNNFSRVCGVGEREGRIYSAIVERRHFGFAHGVGRSGDITAVQPKAAGSSLLMKLTNALAEDVLKLAGARHVARAFVVPMATGMSLLLCLRTLGSKRPGARYVLWPRIDQKSCFKSIVTAGFVPVVIENCLEGDELRTNVSALEQKIVDLGADNIVCILTTTGCFAPRGIDRLEDVAMLCKQRGIPHLVNNAYGVQSSKCMHHIEQASRLGRLDAFVQSTDKNFMVPVGGCIVAGYDAALVDEIGKAYPGRASGTAVLDLFITLLSLGANGYMQLLRERKAMYDYLLKAVRECAGRHGQRVLHTPNNPISIAVTLALPLSDSTVGGSIGGKNKGISDLTEIGAMLFRRNVSGVRVVVNNEEATVCNYRFLGFGSHCDSYPCAYLTAAATIGMTKSDVDTFVLKLDDVLSSAVGIRSERRTPLAYPVELQVDSPDAATDLVATPVVCSNSFNDKHCDDAFESDTVRLDCSGGAAPESADKATILSPSSLLCSATNGRPGSTASMIMNS